eukprot:Em0001g3102a
MDYFSSLNAIGQQRYMDKLRLLDLSLANDPYNVANSINFVKDMSHWPPIEYGHIFCYFVARPGVYTRQQMLQWKQLDAYNYFTSGFVRTVEMWDLRNTSEGCSHVAAILFKVEAAIRNGYTAITSSSCQWNEVFTTKPNIGHQFETAQPFSQNQKMFFKGLKTIMPKSAILTQLQPLVSAPPPLTPAVKKLSDLIMNLRQPRYSTISKDELEIECDRIFREGLKTTQGEADYLEKCTKLQTQSVLWFSHRKGRITASKFSAVCHTSISSPSQSLVEGILKEQNSARRGIPALDWGLEKEPCAREEYRQEMKKTHVNFKIEQAGLFVNPLYPHLGASPDGLITRDPMVWDEIQPKLDLFYVKLNKCGSSIDNNDGCSLLFIIVSTGNLNLMYITPTCLLIILFTTIIPTCLLIILFNVFCNFQCLLKFR